MLTNAAKDTYIELSSTAIEAVPKYANRSGRKGVRAYKYSPDRVALQIWGMRTNTPMYGIAYLDKDSLINLRDTLDELSRWL